MRIRGGMHALALARRRDFVDLPGQARADPERVPRKGQGPDVLGLRGVVERSRAAGDAIDLASRRRGHVESAVSPDRDGRDFLLRERRDRLGLSRWADPDDPARISRREHDRAVLLDRRSEQARLVPAFDALPLAGENQSPLGGHRNPPRLAEREIRRGVHDPDLRRRREKRPGREGGAEQGDARHPPAEAACHQILGSTSIFRRTDPDMGTG